MAVIVRDAVPGDLPSVQAIYAWHVENGLASFEETAPDLAEIARRHAEVRARGLPYLVAEVEGGIGGYAYAGVYRARPAYRFTVENSVYIDRARVGQGIGRALLTALIDRCEAAGVRQMIAVIGDSANAASIGLHAVLGFERVGILPAVGFKFGRWVDSVLMQRAIGAGSSTPPAGVR